MIEQNIIERQQEFVTWLKSKDLYNEYDSAIVMQRMQHVWEACNKIFEFTLFWLTGESEIIEGKNIQEAMNSAGYGQGSLGALDFFKEGSVSDDYTWIQKLHNWCPTNNLVEK